MKRLCDQLTKLEFKEARHSTNPEDVETLWAALENADEDERHALRDRLSGPLAAIIDELRFDGQNGHFDVIVLGGLRGYRFSTDGTVVATFVLSSHVKSGAIPLAALTGPGQEGTKREKVARRIVG